MGANNADDLMYVNGKHFFVWIEVAHALGPRAPHARYARAPHARYARNVTCLPFSAAFLHTFQLVM